MINTLGQILQIVAIIMVVWGIPRQILLQYKNNRFGMDILFSFIILAVYILRAWYTLLKGDWYIFVPDVIGSFLSIINILQYWNPKLWWMGKQTEKLMIAIKKGIKK
jgi:cation transport ATPase